MANNINLWKKKNIDCAKINDLAEKSCFCKDGEHRYDGS